MSEQNYEELKTYYLNQAEVQEEPSIKKQSAFLANQIDIELKNYSEAINWYETILENPETDEDSIFAAIDISYIYDLMEQENGRLKSAQIGKYPQLKFDNKIELDKNRDYLISLLFKDVEPESNNYNDFSNFNVSGICNIHPNPTQDKATLEIELTQKSNIEVRIYNVFGSMVHRQNFGELDKGLQNKILNLNDLPNGIYFCTVFVDNQKTNAIKLIIEK